MAGAESLLFMHLGPASITRHYAGTDAELRRVRATRPGLDGLGPLYAQSGGSGRIGAGWACAAGLGSIVLSSQVKLPSLLALGFVTGALAYRCGGTVRRSCCAAPEWRRCRWR